GPDYVGTDTVFGGPIEIVFGVMKGKYRRQVTDILEYRQRRADYEQPVRAHIHGCWSGRHGTNFDAQMAAACVIKNGPVPRPRSAMVQSQFGQFRYLSPINYGHRIFFGHQWQGGRIQGGRGGKQLPGTARPAVAVIDPWRVFPGSVVGRPAVDGLFEQGDTGFVPEVVAEQAGRIAGQSQRNGRHQLHGVEIVGKALGRNAPVQLE